MDFDGVWEQIWYEPWKVLIFLVFTRFWLHLIWLHEWKIIGLHNVFGGRTNVRVRNTYDGAWNAWFSRVSVGNWVFLYVCGMVKMTWLYRIYWYSSICSEIDSSVEYYVNQYVRKKYYVNQIWKCLKMPIFKGLLMFMKICMYYAIPSSMIGNENSLVSKLFYL